MIETQILPLYSPEQVSVIEDAMDSTSDEQHSVHGVLGVFALLRLKSRKTENKYVSQLTDIDESDLEVIFLCSLEGNSRKMLVFPIEGG